jgi:hypothetical protein
MDASNFDAIKANPIDDPDREAFTAQAIEDGKATAHRLLRAMLGGRAVSRLNCHHYKVAHENASIHSAASFLKNAADIPLSSAWTDEKVCAYWLEPEEITAFNDPERREIQARKTRNQTQSRRFYRSLIAALRLVRAVREFGISERYPFVLEGLRTLHREIGEVIKKEGRAAKAPAANMDIFEATEGTEATNG